MGMNLTIEQMRGIVDGAPETTTVFCDGKYYEEWSHNSWVVSDGNQWIDCKRPIGQMIKLDSLRAAIADHDRTDYVSDIRNHIAPTTRVIEG